jgi:hypothetical protein
MRIVAVPFSKASAEPLPSRFHVSRVRKTTSIVVLGDVVHDALHKCEKEGIKPTDIMIVVRFE